MLSYHYQCVDSISFLCEKLYYFLYFHHFA